MTRRDAPPGEPVLVVDDRVTGATDEVLAAGVVLGMPRREAEALAPFATVLPRDLGDEARRFESVVQSVERLVPRVEVVSPGLLFVPVAGAVRFYGGEEALAKRIDEDLQEQGDQERRDGWQALIGIADGPFAARWAAATAHPGEPKVVTDTIGFLSRLDLSSLRESMGGEEMIETFRWLGLATLGDLARLPRESLATRFGNQGVMAHRLATGEDRLVDPREIPPELGVEMSFEDPLVHLDAVAFAGRTMGERMLQRLRAAGVAPHCVTITALAAEGPSRRRVWRSADPFTEKALLDRVWWQLRAWVETAGVPGGIVGLSIYPDDLSGEGRQLGILSDESSVIETERALARAQALLGPEGVVTGRVQGGRMPGERVAWSRWGEPEAEASRDRAGPWTGATPSPAPALVPPNLEPLEIEWDGGMPVRVRLGTRWEPVLTWSGPWRLSGRWWAGEEHSDRYQIVTSAGALLCVVSGGRSFLAGVYD
ncbi:MAG: DNA polymerase Y family protein [Acidimicrobiia bacterium]|nr:DNA polymerase Y family protein [Acidimicrobiia bacterium]